jgi:hypothetical protein
MLVFTKTDKNIVISGKTFYAKEAIKAIGGKWDHATSSWTISSDVATDVLKGLEEAAKNAKKKEKAVTAFAASPEGIAKGQEEERQHIMACLEQKKKDGSFHWICCEKCIVIDWGRKHTSCQACAEWSGQSWNTFRVRGSIFTGD